MMVMSASVCPFPLKCSATGDSSVFLVKWLLMKASSVLMSNIARACGPSNKIKKKAIDMEEHHAGTEAVRS